MEILPTIFGEDFLRYVLAQDDLNLADLVVSRKQGKVLRELMDLALQMQAQPTAARQVGLLNAVLSFTDDRQTTLANGWRRQCGGEVITPAGTSDQVLASLLALARDVYPALLLSRPEDGVGTSDLAISGPIFLHPAWSEFCHAILRDQILQTLFPSRRNTNASEPDRSLREIRSVLTLSMGRTSTLQLALFADILLSGAYRRYLLSAAPHTHELYGSYVDGILNEARSLAARRETNVPLIYGISNIAMPNNTRLEVPWGILRSPTPNDRLFVPRAVEVGAVFETTCEIRLLEADYLAPHDQRHATEGLERHQKDIDRWAQRADRSCDLMRLSILLASPEEQFLVAHQGSRAILDAFHSMPTMRWTATGLKAQGADPSSTSLLDGGLLETVSIWAQNARLHPPSLDIAMRRTLSAVAERADPLDGFIDSVLAWENLFSGRPETNLRVCGAIAWFLEPQVYERRSALYNELSKLYASRSGLVHGSVSFIDNAGSARNRSVQISVECLRNLYARPDLLGAKDSSVRGRMLMLGAASE
jgi:hypothetical protein